MSEQGKWWFDGARVDLFNGSNQPLHLSASDIFEAAFGRTRVFKDISCGNPALELNDIVFSRFPADVAIRVFEELGVLEIQIGVCAAEMFVGIDGDVDQVVVNRRWYPVHAEALAAAKLWLKDIGAKEKASISIGTLIALRTRSDLPVRLIDEIKATSNSIAAGRGTQSIVRGLRANLYPYQTDGIEFLSLVAQQGIGCVLADEMGLGKTLQVIGLIQAECNEGRRPQLVVSPATLLENWRREINRFAPSLTVHVHAGVGRPGIWHGIEEFDVSIVSYETAVRDEILLSAISWNVVALDEAQNIKNPNAQRSLVVKRLPRRVSIAVTGTPLENRLDDLWSIMDYALPGMLGTLRDFQQEFSNDLSDARRIASLVAPAILRRRVLEVAGDLPEKIEIPQPIEMSQKMAEGYEELRQRTLEEYGRAAGLVALTKLRQFCAHPSLCGKWSASPVDEMPKYERLLEILEEVFEANEKALIFSSFTGLADLMCADLRQRYIAGYFRIIDGRTSIAERQPLIDAFYSHEGHGALLLNPRAAGAGLNITAANHVIHCNPEWNPSVTAQASARAYRRGQARPVTVHHLFFANSVEEYIVDRASFKRELAGEAVTGHEGDIDPLLIAEALEISPIRSMQLRNK